jgi:pimeloyl-ACP methyl ester carboxylesterase
VIVCLHGFMDSWHTWDLVRPYLGGDVLAPPLPGHLGGRPLDGDLDLATDIERVLDEAGLETAHFVGNSLGGYLALLMAERGRARSVVAFAPAGGGDHSDTLALQESGAVTLGRVTARPVPPLAALHLAAAVRACDAAPLIANAREHGWPLDPAKIGCPVRIVWGTEDQLLPYPAAAENFRRRLHADWVELEGVGHAPQLEVPLEAAQLIVGFM